MELDQLDKVTLHFRFICPLEEYREVQTLITMIGIGREADLMEINETADRQMGNILSFGKKMTEGTKVVSDEPGKEISIHFKCTASEYAAIFKCLNHGAIFYSQLPHEQNINADKAILATLFRNRLRDALLVPDIELLMETDDAIYLKDTGKGKVSITQSAEFISQYYADCGRIFYVDTESRWAEIVHRQGNFMRFDSIEEEEILQLIATLTPES
ncbi:MAG: hypothetical protein LBP64_01535 [Tannerella sp.]|nr:hypothetical protein [Tannerella sp.]